MSLRILLYNYFVCFFFSSRRRHTRWNCDWSSDVCSSDLPRWGRDRGTSIDRHYIEGFLETHRADVRGRALEVRDSTYTRRFGGDAVTTGDVIDVDPGNGLATVIADLRRADAIPSATYD